MALTNQQKSEIFAVNRVHGQSLSEDYEACIEQVEIMITVSNPAFTFKEAKEEIETSLKEKYSKGDA